MNLGAMERQYLVTALWAEVDRNEEPLDKNYSLEDIAPESVLQAEKDCAEFYKKAQAALSAEGFDIGELDLELLGHDFWLTRNGHGAGFWDGDYEKRVGEILTKLSKEFGEKYAADDRGQVFIEGRDLDLSVVVDGKVYGLASSKLTEAKDEEESRKPIEREVTIKITLKEAAEALGYLSGRNAWSIANDYLDADYDIFNDYFLSDKEIQNFSVKGMDDVQKIFPWAVSMAINAAQNEAYAADLTKARHQAIEAAMEKIDVTGEYMTADHEMISVSGASIKSCVVDAPADEVTLVIKNPEHLINDLMNGDGRFYPEFDPYEAAPESEIKKYLHYLGSYFEIYGDKKPEAELDSRYSPDADDDVVADEVKYRISELSVDDIADAVISAVEDGRFENENEAILLAVKYSGEPKAEIVKAVKNALGEKESKLSKRKDSVEESVQAKEVKLHSTYKPDHYYVSFSDLPKEAQEKLKAAEVEVERSSYTLGEDMAFIRAEVEVNGKIWNAEISLGSVDIRNADYEWDDEENAYVDEEGRPIDSNAHAEYMASELAAMSELEHQDVYLDLIESVQVVSEAEKKSLDDRAEELLKLFSDKVSIEKTIEDEIEEIEIGDLVFNYGGREVSVCDGDNKTYIFDVNSIGDKHSYLLFDIVDENGETVEESAQAKKKPLIESSAQDAPSVYVGTYAKYNEGSLDGKWLNLEDYKNVEEFLDAAKELHKDEEDPELMFQDFMNFPEKYYGESHIKPELWDWIALSDSEKELVAAYYEKGDQSKEISDVLESHAGTFEDRTSWILDWIDEGLIVPSESNLYVDDVTARAIALEDADSYVSDLSDSDAVSEAGLEDEFEAAEKKESLQSELEDLEGEEEPDSAKIAEIVSQHEGMTSVPKSDEVVAKARDQVQSDRADSIEASIKRDAVDYFVNELGAYTAEEFAKQSFVSVDYNSIARDLEIDGYDVIEKSGQIHVFRN